jgi:hypothetical protein
MDKASDLGHRWDHQLAAPLGRVASGRLVIGPKAARLSVRGDPAMAELYQARFQSPPPAVQVQGGTVTVRSTCGWPGSPVCVPPSARRRGASCG